MSFPKAKAARRPSTAGAADTKVKEAEAAADTARERREYLRFEICDFHCKGLSKTVPARHKDENVYMYSGALAYGSLQRVMVIPEEIGQAGCPNAKLLPDWSTEQVLPWACRKDKGIVVRRVYCEMEGLKCGPRALCGKLLAELRAFDGLKMELLTGGELEFVMASKAGGSGEWEPLFREPEIFTTLQGCKVMDFCYELEHQMLQVGVDILTMNTEYGEGQVEITFAPKFGIEAADMTATFRLGTKELAQQQGLRATFMAKPFGISGVGNGGHMNFSIWAPTGTTREAEKSNASAVAKMTAGKRNVFHSPEDGLSSTAKAFLAGILAHAPALEALCSPTVPCYCRHGNWAPTVANWGYDDRTACVRVKADKRGAPASCYMELRMPSSAANPYLVMAGLVACGLDGLQRNLALPPERQSQADGATLLPSSLPAALEALEADEYLTSKLGKRFIRWYVDIKRAELKFLDEQLHPPREASEASREPSESEIGRAWRELYMEFN